MALQSGTLLKLDLHPVFGVNIDHKLEILHQEVGLRNDDTQDLKAIAMRGTVRRWQRCFGDIDCIENRWQADERSVLYLRFYGACALDSWVSTDDE